ncbi:MAG: hypothetical protein ACK5UY_08170 [Holosporales bacterium]
MSSRVLRFSPILAHPKLDTLRDIPLAIYWDICLNDDKEIHARAKDIFLLYHGIDSTNFSPLEKVPTVKQLGEKHNISQGIIRRSFESANRSFFPRFKASATDILPTMTENFQLGSWLTYRSGMQALGEQNKAVNDIWVAISGPNYS